MNGQEQGPMLSTIQRSPEMNALALKLRWYFWLHLLCSDLLVAVWIGQVVLKGMGPSSLQTVPLDHIISSFLSIASGVFTSSALYKILSCYRDSSENFDQTIWRENVLQLCASYLLFIIAVFEGFAVFFDIFLFLCTITFLSVWPPTSILFYLTLLKTEGIINNRQQSRDSTEQDADLEVEPEQEQQPRRLVAALEIF